MSVQSKLSRRALFAGATTILAGTALAAVSAPSQGFTHGVASGDPLATRVMLWTRFVPKGGGTQAVLWEVAHDPSFARIVRTGTAFASPDRDHTVKVDVSGLKPGERYVYRFVVGQQISPLGHTRTLPQGRTETLKLALFSCSNLAFGYFNAYRHCAEQSDIDIALHVGDYIYEYGPGHYPGPRESITDRLLDPTHDIVALADYRARYANYRTDADLQALHAAKPMIAVWDDHEFANDNWMHGAQNHHPDTQGDWADRRAAAIRAYDEWMPVRPTDAMPHYRSFQWGDLASLILLDTRDIGRDQQLDLAAAFKFTAAPTPDALKVAIEAFMPRWQDESRQLMGKAQEDWFAAELARSKAAATPWQVIAQQIVVGFNVQPKESLALLRADVPAFVKARTEIGALLGAAGIPGNMDNWGGYPAARRRFLQAIKASANNAIVLSGDSHNAWAFELPGGDNGAPLAVEIAGQSVTSSGIESAIDNSDAAARALIAANPELKWCNVAQRGYATLSLTHDMATAEWLMFDTVRSRAGKVSERRTARIRATPGVGVGSFEWV